MYGFFALMVFVELPLIYMVEKSLIGLGISTSFQAFDCMIFFLPGRDWEMFLLVENLALDLPSVLHPHLVAPQCPFSFLKGMKKKARDDSRFISSVIIQFSRVWNLILSAH